MRYKTVKMDKRYIALAMWGNNHKWFHTINFQHFLSDFRTDYTKYFKNEEIKSFA